MSEPRERFAARLGELAGELLVSAKNVTKNRLLHEIIDITREINVRTLPAFEDVLISLRVLCCDKEKIIRHQSLRVLRYLITDVESIQSILRLNLDLFVVRTLERKNNKDQKFERVQALKLVIRIIEVAPMLVPRTIVQSMVNIIGAKPEDDLRRVCLDRIRELASQNPEIVASSGGIHAMVEAILDPRCEAMAGQLTMTLLYLLDQDSTRRYLRPEVHIQQILSVFTDTETPNSSPAKEARRLAAHKALMIIMRSWTGIFILASDPLGLRSLVDILSLPPTVKHSAGAKDAVFMLLLNILSVVKSEDLSTHKAKQIWKHMGPNLLHSYVVMVLLSFIEAGLVPILAEIGMEQDQEMSGVATNLLREILHLAADLLPSDPWGAQLNALPSVIQSASSGDGKRVVSRVLARDMLDKMSTPRGPGFDTAAEEKSDKYLDARLLVRERSASIGDGPSFRPLVHGLDLESIAVETDTTPTRLTGLNKRSSPRILTSRKTAFHGQLMSMHRRITTSSDDVIDRLMAESGVIVVKQDPKKWDWDKILYLLEGPLATNPQYLITVMKNTKFCKRLLSFLLPSKLVFAKWPWNTDNIRCVKVANQLFRVLCGNQETCQNKQFRQCIEEIFTELAAEATRGTKSPLSPKLGHTRASSQSVTSSGDMNIFASSSGGGKASKRFRPFSAESVREKLAREYFTLLGIVSASKHGSDLIRKYDFYGPLYSLYKDESKDYLARLILSSLNYGNNKNARTLLDSWVKSGSVNLRKYAIAHLRVLLRDKSSDILSHFWQWGVRLLASQLGHSNEELALSALSVLEEVCQDEKCLEFLIKYKPTFANIGAAANNLQTKFLSKANGVAYLSQIDWIEPQMQLWMSEGNQKYVEAVENALVGAFDTGMKIPKVGRAGSGVTAGARGGAASGGGLLNPPITAEKKRPEYGYGFGGIHCSIRTEYDDYFFARLHRLPWKANVSLEYANRSTYHILADAFVHTVPHIANTVYRNRAESTPSGLDFKRAPGAPAAGSGGFPRDRANSSFEANLMMAETPNGLETYIAAVVVGLDGKPKPQKLDEGVTIFARLSIGSGEAGTNEKRSGYARRFEQVCYAADRVNLPETKKGHCCLETKQARWNFCRGPPAGSRRAMHGPTSSSLRRKASGGGDRLYLRSIWFRIPTPNSSNPVVCLAPHFFGELAKTESGCRIIRESGHFDKFVDTVSKPLSDSEAGRRKLEEAKAKSAGAASTTTGGSRAPPPRPPTVGALQMRTALWAIGQIGSSETGFKLLKQHKFPVVNHISNMALNCRTLSMRGTCFYIMGLLSRTPSAREQLYDLGWRFSPNPDVGIVIPTDTRRFLGVRPGTFHGSWPQNSENKFGLEHVPVKNAPRPQTTYKPGGQNIPAVILGHISNLCNNVTIKASLHVLRSLRKDKSARHCFTSAKLFFEVFRMITAYNFQLEARRFVFDELFDEVKISEDTLRAFDQPLQERTKDVNILAPKLPGAAAAAAGGPSASAGGSEPRSGKNGKNKTTLSSTQSRKKPKDATYQPKYRVVGFSLGPAHSLGHSALA